MIPDLLWRCPLCAVNDALRHSQRWLQPEEVDCTACGAKWRVRREVGDNYYLKITRSGKLKATFPPGFEQSITAWYDLMKQTVHLEALPEPPELLEAGEKLYLASGPASLWSEAQPDLSKAEPLHPAIEENTSLSGANLPVTEAEGGRVGMGRLFLTNQRLIWQQTSAVRNPPASSADPRTLNFPLRQVDGVYTILNLGLSLVAGMQLYTLRFANESPLKWVTYVALLAPQVQVESGHCIRTSHY